MKRFKIMFATAGVLLIMVSCNKDYTCECFSSGNKYELSSDSKEGADAACEKYQDDPFNGNCELI